jgi:hypothetical protein
MSCDYCPDYYIHKEFIPEEFNGNLKDSVSGFNGGTAIALPF